MTQNYPTFHGYEMNVKKLWQYRDLLELLRQLYGSGRGITMAARKDPDHIDHTSMVAAGFRRFAEFYGETKACLLRMIETAIYSRRSLI